MGRIHTVAGEEELLLDNQFSVTRSEKFARALIGPVFYFLQHVSSIDEPDDGTVVRLNRRLGNGPRHERSLRSIVVDKLQVLQCKVARAEDEVLGLVAVTEHPDTDDSDILGHVIRVVGYILQEDSPLWPGSG